MIPRDHYVLFLIDERGTGVMEVPMHYQEGVCHPRSDMIVTCMVGGSDPTPKRTSPYMSDYRDVVDYIKRKGLVGKCKRLVIAKTVDIVSLKIESDYNDKE